MSQVPVEVSIYVVSDPYTTFCFLAFVPAMAERLRMEFHDQNISKHCQNYLNNIENIRGLSSKIAGAVQRPKKRKRSEMQRNRLGAMA